jgi:hypothetical protein
MGNQIKLVEKTVLEFIRSMRTGTKSDRRRKYREYLFNLDDLRWIMPRNAASIWEEWEPMIEAIGTTAVEHYRASMLKLGADRITVKAFLINRRSALWDRYGEVKKEFRRLPALYGVQTITPFYEHESKPYLYLRGRVIFWPGLEKFPEINRGIDETHKERKRDGGRIAN